MSKSALCVAPIGDKTRDCVIHAAYRSAKICAALGEGVIVDRQARGTPAGVCRDIRSWTRTATAAVVRFEALSKPAEWPSLCAMFVPTMLPARDVLRRNKNGCV